MCGPQAAATDGTIFARYDTSQVVIFEISSSAAELNEFIQVFGQRFIGLVDNQGVYGTYRVPNPEAPYPQDYIIDQQGIVRYWSDEYDPQELIRVIDGLLATSVEENESEVPEQSELRLIIGPNPTRGLLNIDTRGIVKNAIIKIYSMMGRCVFEKSVSDVRISTLTLDLPSGEYLVTIESADKMLTGSITVAK
ncbi:MAG: T9SS type A sorting domain-containing protein [bacterium]